MVPEALPKEDDNVFGGRVEVGAMIPFPDKKYQIIYADPPWECSNDCVAPKSYIKHSDSFHYNSMKLVEICNIKVLNISDNNCLLFLWIRSPALEEGLQVGNSWGFKYITIAFVWYKQRIVPGHYNLSECEICLLFKKGKIPQPRGARNVRQFLSELRRKHSQKPDIIRNRITEMFPTQFKIELFARERTKGWDAWGDEVNKRRSIIL